MADSKPKRKGFDEVKREAMSLKILNLILNINLAIAATRAIDHRNGTMIAVFAILAISVTALVNLHVTRILDEFEKAERSKNE